MNTTTVQSNFQQSFEYLNETLIEKGVEPFSINEAKDWGIVGGESYSELDSLIHEFFSIMQSEKAANNHYNKYGY
jgi:hypothetical protein